jgi:hypothetical protein
LSFNLQRVGGTQLRFWSKILWDWWHGLHFNKKVKHSHFNKLREFWSVYVFSLMNMLKNISIKNKLNYQNVDQSYVDKLNVNRI